MMMADYEVLIEEMCDGARSELGVANVLYAAKSAGIIDNETHQRLSDKFGIAEYYFF